MTKDDTDTNTIITLGGYTLAHRSNQELERIEAYKAHEPVYLTWLHALLSVGLCSSLLIVIFLLQLPMGVAVLAMLLLFFVYHKWNALLPLFIIRHSTRGLRTNSAIICVRRYSSVCLACAALCAMPITAITPCLILR